MTRQPTHPTASDPTEDVIDLREILATILNEKWKVIITAFIFVVIAVIYCLLRAPVYQTDLLLNVSSQGSSMLQSSLLQNIPGLGSSFGQANPVNTEMNVLSSRAVLVPVIKKLNLDIQVKPAYFPLIGHPIARAYDRNNFNQQIAPPKLGLSRYNWGGSQLKIESLEVSPALLEKPILLIAGKDGHYQLKYQDHVIGEGTVGSPLSLTLNQDVTLKLTVKSLKANEGARFSIEKLRMVDVLKNLNTLLSVSQADKMASLLTITIQGEDARKITDILNAIGLSAMAQSTQEQADQSARTIAFLKARIPGVEKELIQSEKALNDYRSQTGNISTSDQGQALLTQIGTVQTQITTLAVAKATASQQYTPNSYQIKTLDTQIQSLKAERTKLENMIKALPNADQQLMQLERNVTVQNAVYTNLLSNLQQFELLQAGAVGDVQIVDQAYLPYYKSNKPAPLVIVLFAILGLFLSIAYIFIRKYLFQGIEDPEIFENKYNLPVMGTLQSSKLQTKQLEKLAKGSIKHLSLLEEIDPHDITVESFRSLRTTLLFELREKKDNLILISGPTPNVGKSFVSVNTAASFAETGKKILLIEADIRRGSIHQYFLQARYPGLCDYLGGNTNIEACIHKTRIENLDLMPTGHLPKRHTQLLMQGSFEQLILSLKKEYDLIIIDTAPVLAVPDATIVGKLAAVKLLVFGYGEHNEREVRMTAQRFEKAGLWITGCIVNKIKTSTSRYSNKYQYAYHYKQDNNSNKPK